MQNQFDVCVVGMGYVGVTLAAVLADKGLKVFGLEVREEVVTSLNDGNAPFFEYGLDDLIGAAVRDQSLICGTKFPKHGQSTSFVITVGTPLDAAGNARIDMISKAAAQVADVMPEKALVVLRSTTMIGTTREIVKPILDQSGKSYCLAMCPERTLEGRAVEELEALPQVIGGIDAESGARAGELFSKLTPTTVKVASPETAEMIKLVDNTYRDVQFGFANEVARACEAVGVNAAEVIKLGKLGYSRTNVALPGPVGGPCLEKDPHILMQSVLARSDVELDITRSARLTNERQPARVVRSLSAIIDGFGIASPTVVVLGLAFKGRPATDDLRGSMAFSICAELVKQINAVNLCVYDPVISDDKIRREFPTARVMENLSDAVTCADVVVIANNHEEFSKNTVNFYSTRMKMGAIIYDFWNHFSVQDLGKFAGRYFSVGNIPRFETKGHK